MCRSCQLGKQTKTSHIESQLGPASKVLELVHMDLMGSMRGGKHCWKKVCLCVQMISPDSLGQASLEPNQKLLKHFNNYG